MIYLYMCAFFLYMCAFFLVQAGYVSVNDNKMYIFVIYCILFL